MSQLSQSLLDRIRKIWAKAESLKAMGPEYEHEAMTAMGMAQKMMAMHKLSLSDLEVSKLNTTDPLGMSYARSEMGVTKQWVVDLSHAVATAHFCRILLSTKTKDIVLVGRETDRQIAEYILTTLLRYATERSDKEARAFRKTLRKQVGMTYGDNKDFRAAWLRGFVNRVAERYAAERQSIEIEAAKTSTGLIRLKDAMTPVNEFFNQVRGRGTVKTSERRSANSAGRSAGYAAGGQVSIRGTAIGGSAGSQRLLR